MTNQAALLSALLRSDFSSFVRKCFNEIVRDTTFTENWHIHAIAYGLNRVRKGEVKRLIINQPPRSLKSISVSVAFVAWLLGHDPTRRIIVVSYSVELALELHRQFKMVINSDWYRKLFPRMRLARDSALEAVTTLGGGRYATSIEGTLTGRGANLIIIDDPHKADEALSEKARNQVVNWFSGTLLSRLDDKRSGQIILVMQRLHPDDLSGHLIETGNWHHLNLPAQAPEDQWVPTGPNTAEHWRCGEPLQIEREGTTVLDAIKRDLGSQKFSAQYLQQPVPAGGNAVKREWLGFYDAVPTFLLGDRIVQSWDVAAGIGENNDFSVGTTWLRRATKYYLIDVFRQRLPYPDLRRRIVSLAREFGADTVLIEKAGFGLTLLQEIRAELPIGMIEPLGIVPRGGKQERLAAQSAKIEAGRIFLPKEAPWLADFLHELLAFPNGRHDDQVDSLSQFLFWASDSWPLWGIETGLPIFGGGDS
jgi:predicted phage terminase large subunit-like protein